MKLILGTVQLGINYGMISKNKPTLKQSLEILNHCIENNINTFDTAQNYGNSENIISNISNKNIKIITKIIFNEENSTTLSFEKTLELVNTSLNNLKVKSLDVLLLHEFNDFLSKNLINNLFKIKDNGLIKNIGVSVYNVEEAIDVLKDERFKIIQIPFNYLDSQWNNVEFKSLIKKRTDIEIHIRSIFLQGILVNDFKYWPKIKNLDFKPIHDNILYFCSKYNLNKKELVINYIKSIKWIDSILFGVDNIDQLKENLELFENSYEFNEDILNEFENLFKNVPTELVNPCLWK